MGEVVRVRVTGLDAVQVWFKGMVRRTPKEGKKLTEEMARDIVTIAKLKAGPLGSGTGALKASIRAYPTQSGHRVVAGEGLKRPYAYYQEFGFAPHTIHKNQFAGPKVFGNKKFPYMFVAQHFPYMSPAFRKVTGRAAVYLNRTGDRIIGK